MMLFSMCCADQKPLGRSKSPKGFVMAMLLVFMVIMGILLSKAMPRVTTEVKRDKEAELIFRGLAIQRGIFHYKRVTGRYPTELDQLLKIQPRYLRKVYKDPMTPDGKWDYIYQVQPGITGVTEGLPIVGVRSTCLDDGLKVYQNRTTYSEWIFSADPNLLLQPGGGKLSSGGDTKPTGDGADGGKK